MTLLHEVSAKEAASGDAAAGARTAASAFHQLLAPIAGGIAFSLLVGPDGRPAAALLLGFASFFIAALLVGRERRWAPLLPFMATASRFAAPFVGVLILALFGLLANMPEVGPIPLAGAFAATTLFEALGSWALRRYISRERKTRVAVIGSAEVATSLARELSLSGADKYVVVGRIAGVPEGPAEVRDEVPTLGELRNIGSLVPRYKIDLLVMTGEVPRLEVFNEIAAACLHLPVRLHELSGFYEDVFGHVPVAEINASWFQYIMHPRYRSSPPASKRALDLAIAVTAGICALPIMMLFVLMIRRDGGPVLFKQLRIGEGGRPFTVYKLRTMRIGAPSAAQWASADDPRVTPVGRFLRRTHLDELPQLINVLKGEMSVVGPRPEQPEFVERLEAWVPYYTRRHLVKPGITGWAQVRCGYAGSDVGSAWKLCHDLYYLKHRSLGLDLVILGETIRTLVADRQYSVEPKNVSFILNSDWIQSEQPAPATVAST
jgi:exopolysaccharide biosynthesis polyprenyl glycosylphosphotransferase